MTMIHLHLSVVMSGSLESRSLTLLALGAMMALVLAAIRQLVRQARVIVMISGTSVLLVFLVVLALAYLITLRPV
ncbi:hypothetical protein GCM10009733_099920 [Nonomuraea maheshkhaliensis]|uniref:Uncharacterized protein n=1 Tax=Nonomuraea maheshkhaliensis TaxID=419590 RepID=A0ABP4TFF8_9ACTN